MRGSKTLFNDIFSESKTKKTGKGRSKEMHTARNSCLIDRYYYLGQFTKYKYEVVIGVLSQEFFLSTVTIPEIIDGCYEQLKDLKKRQPGIKYFKGKWPHLVWENFNLSLNNSSKKGKVLDSK